MKKIIYIFYILLLSSCDSFELSGITPSDIKKACAQIASSRNYESSLRMRLIHELDEKAGKSFSSNSLVEAKIINMNLAVQAAQYRNEYTSFELECVKSLEDNYLK